MASVNSLPVKNIFLIFIFSNNNLNCTVFTPSQIEILSNRKYKNQHGVKLEALLVVSKIELSSSSYYPVY